jgi:hypothetical protein
MVKQTDADFDAQIDAWFEKYKDQVDDFVSAKTVEYDPKLNTLIIGLSDDRRLAIPIQDLQGLGNATEAQLQNVEILGLGGAINFPDIDTGFYVPSLIEGIYGNRQWMEKLGKRGG